MVIVTQKQIANFDNIEVVDEVEVFLIKGDQASIEIEADDNLHDAFDINVTGKTLHLGFSKEISGAKKTSVRVTYTDTFKMLIAKDDSNITALAEIKLDDITFKCYDNSRIFLYANSKNFTLIANDKTRVELNLKSLDAVFELSKNTTVKALVSSPKFKCDMYQKATATIEGDVDDLKLRMDNNADFLGKGLVAKNATLIVEGATKSNINVVTKLNLDASGRAEINFYGEGKLDVKRFSDEVTINKKLLK